MSATLCIGWRHRYMRIQNCGKRWIEMGGGGLEDPVASASILSRRQTMIRKIDLLFQMNLSAGMRPVSLLRVAYASRTLLPAKVCAFIDHATEFFSGSGHASMKGN
ncbi:MAG: hypothetical protein LBV73_11570 [Paraburkholderia sp.]|nr:hypothetical protein [Paraburkholderia sp.]